MLLQKWISIVVFVKCFRFVSSGMWNFFNNNWIVNWRSFTMRIKSYSDGLDEHFRPFLRPNIFKQLTDFYRFLYAIIATVGQNQNRKNSNHQIHILSLSIWFECLHSLSKPLAHKLIGSYYNHFLTQLSAERNGIMWNNAVTKRFTLQNQFPLKRQKNSIEKLMTHLLWAHFFFLELFSLFVNKFQSNKSQ